MRRLDLPVGRGRRAASRRARLRRPAADERRTVFLVGVWASVGCLLSGVAYAAQTWEEPHRLALVIVSVLGVPLGALPGLWLFGRDRPAPSERAWNRFQIAWGVGATGAIATVSLIDGGARSPFLAGFIVVQIYAALFYPTRAALLAGVGNVLVGAAIIAISPAAARPYGIAVLAGVPGAAGMAVFHARTQRRHRHELDRLARVDPLTGALNRRGFADRMAIAVSAAREDGQTLHLVVVDLDGFKRVNDTQGHAAGDEVLRWVVESLRAAPWRVDSVGRLGGDEFAVLLEPGAATHAEITAVLRERLAERTAASLGGARLPDEGTEAAELLALADARAYAEKGLGRAAGPAAAEPQA